MRITAGPSGTDNYKAFKVTSIPFVPPIVTFALNFVVFASSYRLAATRLADKPFVLTSE